jgi:RimJ/RimL family protein N-acetyltransferase
MTLLASERLLGRPVAPERYWDLRRLHGDPLVMKTLSASGEPHPEQTSKDSIVRALAHWQAHGFGTWFFERKSDAAFVGYCGLRHYLVDGLAETELLYAVASAHWRKGYGTEMARRVVAYGLDGLGLKNLVAFTLAGNEGSRRIMELCGLRYEKNITHAGLPHVLYRLRA